MSIGSMLREMLWKDIISLLGIVGYAFHQVCLLSFMNSVVLQALCLKGAMALEYLSHALYFVRWGSWWRNWAQSIT